MKQRTRADGVLAQDDRILEDDVPVAAAGQGGRAEQQADQFVYGSIPL